MYPDVERELKSMRAMFERELVCFRELSDQRDETRMEALRVAIAANERRLDTMAEIRQEVSDQGGRMVTRQESESALDALAARVEQNRVNIESRVEIATKPLSERMEQNRSSIETRIEELSRPNWALMVSVFSVCILLIGGAWGLTGLKFDASVVPVALSAEQVKAQVNILVERMRQLETATAGSAQADATSVADRRQLNDRVRGLETQMASNAAERRSQFAVTEAKLIEIETQFCASDIVRNLLHAQDMRLQAVLWARVYEGERMPTDNAYYAQICQRGGDRQTVQ